MRQSCASRSEQAAKCESLLAEIGFDTAESRHPYPPYDTKAAP